MIRSNFDQLRRNKSARENRNLSLRALSAETGLSQVTILRMKADFPQRFDAKTLDILCEYFNCPLSDLLEYTTERQEKFRGYHIHVYPRLNGTWYDVVFESGLMQIRGAGGKPQEVKSPTAKVQNIPTLEEALNEEDNWSISWKNRPDGHKIGVEEFEEEAILQVYEFLDRGK